MLFLTLANIDWGPAGRGKYNPTTTLRLCPDLWGRQACNYSTTEIWIKGRGSSDSFPWGVSEDFLEEVTFLTGPSEPNRYFPEGEEEQGHSRQGWYLVIKQTWRWGKLVVEGRTGKKFVLLNTMFWLWKGVATGRHVGCVGWQEYWLIFIVLLCGHLL